MTKQTKKHYKSLEFQTIITKDMVKSFSWFISLNHMFSRLKESGISKTQKIAVTHTHTHTHTHTIFFSHTNFKR